MPPYLRIAGEIAADIAAGRLVPGDRIPSITEIRSRHGVATQTAANVLAHLSERGLVTAIRGRGTFVAARASAAEMLGDLRNARTAIERAEKWIEGLLP